jgi:hypothetical protein
MAGTVAVTAIAAVASYDHMRTLAAHAGQPPLLAALLPVSEDGLLLVASAAIGDGRKRTGSAWAAFLIRMAASLAANVLAAESSAVSRAVSAWPSVALMLTVEIIARAGRGQVATVDASAPEPLASNVAGVPSVAADLATVTEPRTARPGATANETAAKVAAPSASEPNLTTADIAERLGLSARSVRRYRPATA